MHTDCLLLLVAAKIKKVVQENKSRYISEGRMLKYEFSREALRKRTDDALSAPQITSATYPCISLHHNTTSRGYILEKS